MKEDYTDKLEEIKITTINQRMIQNCIGEQFQGMLDE